MQPPVRPSQATLAKWNSNRAGSRGDKNTGAFCYDITDKPLLDPELAALPPAELGRILDVSQQFHEGDHAAFVPELEALVAEFPQIPKLRNHLAAAYLTAGRQDDYTRVVRETYERFPEYLFGIINMGQLALEDGRIDDVPAIFHHTMLLHELQGGRREYHLSEITTWQYFFGRYFIETGDIEVAAHYLDLLKDFNPDHPGVADLERRLLLAMMERTLARMLRQPSNQPPAQKRKKKLTAAKRRKR